MGELNIEKRNYLLRIKDYSTATINIVLKKVQRLYILKMWKNIK